MKPVIILIMLLACSLVFSTVSANSLSFAQISAKPTQLPLPKASLPVNPQASQNATVAKLHTVKITSPAKGQQVPAAKDLTVSGITTDGASHCQVSVIVNSVKPYQPATGAGPRGPADYSKWNFVPTSKYTTIKLGPNNKITAKYSCSNPKGISFYSVTVTGVGAPTTPSVNATSTNNAPILRNTVANNVVSTRGISATSASNATGTNNAALLAKGNTGAAHYVGSHAPAGSISAVANGVHCQIPKAIGTSANNATSKNNVPSLRNIIFNNTIIRSGINGTSAN